MNDLLVASETVGENVAVLKKAFDLLVDNLLELKLEKCSRNRLFGLFDEQRRYQSKS